MPTAYVDSLNDVVATSSAALPLEEAQAKIPGIVAVILDSPEGLITKGSQTALEPYWHRHTSGDGSSIDHYTQIEDPEPLKLKKMAQIDVRTCDLIDAGFEYPPSSGVMYSLSVKAQLKLIGAYSAKDEPEMIYPQKWNTQDNTAFVEINDAAELKSFYLAAVGTVRYHVDSGTALKDQVRAATTVAEVEAIVDGR